MELLCIGNSFSQDATRYLHGIAKSAGEHIRVVNLYIGGCSLERHFRNMLSENEAYTLEVNGHSTGFPVSLKEALLNRAWDVITIQQASHKSFDYTSYQPYAKHLAAYIRTMCPKAKIVIHQTWAYEKDSEKLLRVAKFNHPQDMVQAIQKAYRQLQADTDACGIIPSGEMFAWLLANGIETIHRDTYHASLGLGRYALGLLWFRMLCGKEMQSNTFSDFDEPITEKDRALVKRYVDTVQPL